VKGFGFVQAIGQGAAEKAGFRGVEVVSGVAELAGGVEETGVALAFHGPSFEVVTGAARQALRLLVRSLG
jgi:hypothetical protein